MAEGGISEEARERQANDIARQQEGVLKHVLREEAGMHDFLPGDSKLTQADQAAFDARLKATQRRENPQRPKSLLEKLRDLVGI